MTETYANTTGDGSTPRAWTVSKASINENKPLTVTAVAVEQLIQEKGNNPGEQASFQRYGPNAAYLTCIEIPFSAY